MGGSPWAIDDEYDAIVVGGGPAGSTTATLLAIRGYRVLLLERDRFPRYHIGESTVPGIFPVLAELGILEQVESYGFVKKPGITMRWGKDREPWTTFFGEHGPFDHGFQVVRSEFDHLLLRRSRQVGVTVMEDTRVVEYLFDGPRCGGVRHVSVRGREAGTTYCRFLVDATGQAACLSRQFGQLIWDEELRNVAIWGYFQGATPYAGRRSGNIVVENVRGRGWLWFIPLHDGTASVGWVTRAEGAGGLKQLSESFVDVIAASEECRALLATACRVSAFRTAQDWSYISERFGGPGYLLAGDAAAFIDPLFSTGLFLAMTSGSLAATTVDRVLAGLEEENDAIVDYESTFRSVLAAISSCVHYFYAASERPEQYWAQAQEVIDPGALRAPREDFTLLISGLHGARQVMAVEP